MPNPRRRRLPSKRGCVASALLSTSLLFLAAATARADELITLDLVRHGEAGDTAVVNTLVPGPPLTSTGMDQANAVADVLKGAGIDEIFASAMTRAQQTAAPLATDLGLPVHVLPGLDEINAGVFEGIPVNVGPIPLGARCICWPRRCGRWGCGSCRSWARRISTGWRSRAASAAPSTPSTP
ncbi:histidine phosphatase family protein [Mycobacterium sp.]|uniref:histidine phosphatase family protein n=1 Tax=Mycobacterium sp. TaxID=1785 RepID=UPI0031D47EFF